jgi:carbon monoxide dehydrogenase subunit G
MKIKNQFRVPLPVADAWVVLNDIPRVAHCAPGAELVEARPDGSYIGTVRVKLGPISLSFRGTLVYQERDEASHRVVAEASGNEERARGTARALVAFVLSPEGNETRIDVETDVLLAGSIAQYGRGGALIQSTAQVLMDEFARNFAAEFGGAVGAASSAGGAPEAAAARNAPSVSAFSLIFKALIAMVKSWFARRSAAGARQ